MVGPCYTSISLVLAYNEKESNIALEQVLLIDVHSIYGMASSLIPHMFSHFILEFMAHSANKWMF